MMHQHITLVMEIRHLIVIALGILFHLVWPFLTAYIAYKKFRQFWWLEGLVLGFFCSFFGTLIELFFLTDYSNGRHRSIKDAFNQA